MTSDDIKKQIKSIFDNNQLDDLKRFMEKRKCLNSCNVYMLYLFHLIQSTGILASSIGASLNNTEIIWFGIGLNMIASIIQIYEKINFSQLNHIMKDIQLIKDDKYIDESPFVDIEKDQNNPSLTSNAEPTTDPDIFSLTGNNNDTFIFRSPLLSQNNTVDDYHSIS